VTSLIGLFFVALLIFPVFSLAQPESIVACSGADDCNYVTLLATIGNLINFLIYAAGVVAVIMFVWAGSKMVLSGGNTSAKEEAKKILRNTIIGFIFVLAAWLIVEVILSTLGVEGTPIN